MSAPAYNLPPEIGELMVTTCVWEKFQGFDGHAEPSYAAGKTKKCYREAHSMLQTGLEANRLAEITTSDPDWDLYFDAGDSDVQSFSLYDRFTPAGIGSSDASTTNTETLQPTAINTVLGPYGAEPWMVVVAF